MAGPIEQFEIKTLIDISVAGTDLSITNSTFMMALAVGLSTLLLVVGARKRALVPDRMQSIAEMSYEFIANMVKDNVGTEGRQYFPFVFSLFMFVLFGNLLGMIPFSFTFTSHIIVTFTLALIVFLLVTFIGIARHGLKWFGNFMPTGTPVAMAPLVVPIEIVSYLSRPISLSVRLFANMMAGHTMLKVFAGFSVTLGVVFGLAPLAVNIALTGFEFLVAALQAYVFAILTCLYLHDALHVH